MRLSLLLVLLVGCGKSPPTAVTVTPATQTAQLDAPFQWMVGFTDWPQTGAAITITVEDRGLIEITAIEGEDVSDFEWDGRTATYRYHGIAEAHAQTVTAVCLAADPVVEVVFEVSGVLPDATIVQVACERPGAAQPTPRDEFMLANLIVSELIDDVWTPSTDAGAAANLYLWTEPQPSATRGDCVVEQREAFVSRPVPEISVVTPSQSFTFMESEGVVTASGLVAAAMFEAGDAAEVTIDGREPQTLLYDGVYPPFTFADVDLSGDAPVLEIGRDEAPEDLTVRITMSAPTGDGLTTTVDCTVPTSAFEDDGDGVVLRQALGTMPAFLEGGGDFAPTRVLVGQHTEGTLTIPGADEPLPTYAGDITRFDKPSGFLIWEDDTETPGSDVLTVPVTAPLTSSGQEQVAICESNHGLFVFAASPAGLCPFAPPGTVHTAYLLFRGSPELTVVALEDAHGDTTSDLELLSTTVGTLEDGMPDRVTGIPVDTPTTIVTSDLTVTFESDGSEVTITALRP